MRRLLLCAAAIAALTTQVQAQSRSFYDGGGHFPGSSVTRGNSTSFSNSRGHFAGSSIRHGKSTSFYDGRGGYTGSAITTSPRR
jgi:hypothetical protein